MLTLPPLPPIVRPLTTEESTRLKQHHGDRFPSPQQCPTCGGAGQFRTRDPITHQVVEYQCLCRDQWLLYRFMLNSNIDIVYQRLSWDDITAVKDSTLGFILDYAINVRANLSNGQGLIIYSENSGTGKTLLASLLLKRLLSKGVEGFFISFTELVSLMRGRWKMDEEARDWFSRRIQHTGFLVIDDIGRETKMKGLSDLVEEQLDEMLRKRVYGALPTIITTNYSPEQMLKGYQRRVMSLLSESCFEIECPGEDYRPTARTERARDAKEGLVKPLILE